MAKSKSAPFPYSGKTLLLMGLGPSTLALAEWLIQQGAKLRLMDMQPKEAVAEAAAKLEALGVELDFGRYNSAFFDGAAAVIVNEKIPADTKPLDEAQARSLPILSELEFFLPQIASPIIAVAGSHGKTAAAHLLKEFLLAAGKKVAMVADQGDSLLQLVQAEHDPDFVIVEMSAGWLDHTKTLRPKITLLTSLSAPMPEKYSRAEDYSRALQKLLRNLTAEEVVVYNFRETALRALIPDVQASKRAYRRKDPISLGAEIAQRFRGAYLLNSRELIYTDAVSKEAYHLRASRLFGLYMKENLMAALIAARLLGVSSDKIQAVIDDSSGVPHRLELLKKRGGVRFINDSRATHPDHLLKSLEAFPLDPIILIAGGKDTQADFLPLVDLVKQRVKTMILVGESKEHINRTLGDYSETFLVGTFEEAILMSFQKSRDGDIILLSPGSESYDMFSNYEERGNFFKKYIEEF